MIDLFSWLLGKKKGIDEGTQHVEIQSDNLNFTDDGEGNITVTINEEA